MNKLFSGMALALVVAAGPALAQTTPPPTPVVDTAVEAKFKSADKNASGSLEGAEVDAYKADMAKIDANKDGKISRDEFAAASKTGLIK